MPSFQYIFILAPRFLFCDSIDDTLPQGPLLAGLLLSRTFDCPDEHMGTSHGK